MIISLKHRFIFFHIPKNAGSSITAALKPFEDLAADSALQKYGLNGHARLSDLIRIGFSKEDIMNNYFKFAFVRNPYDRALSNYFYLLEHPENPTHNQVVQAKNFNTYVRALHHTYDITQTKYTHDDAGNLQLDFVGKYENLHQDLLKIQNILGIDFKIDWKNKSQYDRENSIEERINKYYSLPAKKVIQEHHYQEFIAYEYKL